jgi:organic radical activating enzyme
MPETYPVSEIFASVQGEGAQSGTAMVFVRMAGCTVGKPYPKYQHNFVNESPHSDFPIWQNQCTIYDGRTFPCDTDYRKKRVMTVEEIVADIRAQNPLCNWVSITGGEPLMHDLDDLIFALKNEPYSLHLETSGTIQPRKGSSCLQLLMDFDYVVVSPKNPFIEEYCELSDEIRLLVDCEFQWSTLPRKILDNSDRVWISPVNFTDSINRSNVDKCLEILLKHPEVRLSIQMHKVIGAR